MVLLFCGLILWCGVHLVPAAAPSFKSVLVSRLGPSAYRGLFSVMIVASVVLMVVGWRMTDPVYLYDPILYPGAVVTLLMYAAFFLVSATKRPTRIRRWLRHPMLTGILVWSGTHLLANGELRTTLLFGVFFVWAALEMILINRREGPWMKPDLTVSILREAFGAVIVAAVVIVVMMAHPWFAGVGVLGTR